MTIGLAAEVSIPSHLRWIPKGMDVSYKTAGRSSLTAACTVDASTHFHLDAYPGTVPLPVSVTDDDGTEVSAAVVHLWVTERNGSSKAAPSPADAHAKSAPTTPARPQSRL